MGDEALIGLGVLDEAGFAIAAGCGAALLLLVSIVALRVSSVTLLIVGLVLRTTLRSRVIMGTRRA